MFVTHNPKVNRLVKSRNHMSYARFIREVKELRKQDFETHKVSTKTWAGLFFEFIRVIYEENTSEK